MAWGISFWFSVFLLPHPSVDTGGFQAITPPPATRGSPITGDAAPCLSVFSISPCSSVGFSTGICPFCGQQGPRRRPVSSIVYVFGPQYPWTCVCFLFGVILPLCFFKNGKHGGIYFWQSAFVFIGVLLAILCRKKAAVIIWASLFPFFFSLYVQPCLWGFAFDCVVHWILSRIFLCVF